MSKNTQSTQAEDQPKGRPKHEFEASKKEMENIMINGLLQYVKDGTIAPGRKATFDIVIDPTDSEVAIDYTLKIDTSAITGLTNGNSNVSITKAQYKFGDGAVQSANITSADGVTISESLADVEAGKALTMTVTVEWDNEDDENNAADTANGVQGGTITIPVTVTAMQHI